MNEQALKDRLKIIARESNRTFQEVWKSLLLERFLVRLSRSKHQNNLIFKGGFLLSYYLVLGRETIDLDFSVSRMQVTVLQVEKMLIEICEVKMDDGFIMSFSSIEELEHLHMNYPGYRAKINVRFGAMRDRVQVDVGVGDVVQSNQKRLDLYQYKKKPVFECSISLSVYPVETIFSEKLETIISRGSFNSRMKDFHDILLLCRENKLLDVAKLKESIKNTFHNRNAEIELPIVFTQNEYVRMQRLWSEYLKTLNLVGNVLALPGNILDLVEEVNDWLGHQSLI